MVKAPQPELKKYMDRRVICIINHGRKISGIVRGFDPFLNLVLDSAYEVTDEQGTPQDKNAMEQERVELGTVVVRGNCIGMIEAVDRI